MSQQDAAGPSQAPGQIPGHVRDERLKEASFILRMMRRPELGAVMGLVIVTVFFIMVANATMFEFSGVMNFLAPAAQLGILVADSRLARLDGSILERNALMF